MTITFNDRTLSFPADCEQYSDNPEVLHALLQDLEITITGGTVIPSPWDDDMQAVLYQVTVQRDGRTTSFRYHGSHADAEKMSQRVARSRAEVVRGLPYDILCCIGSDYSLLDCEPEDIGMNSDSIKDMAKWNETQRQVKALRACLRLTQEELEALPC